MCIYLYTQGHDSYPKGGKPYHEYMCTCTPHGTSRVVPNKAIWEYTTNIFNSAPCHPPRATRPWLWDTTSLKGAPLWLQWVVRHIVSGVYVSRLCVGDWWYPMFASSGLLIFGHNGGGCVRPTLVALSKGRLQALWEIERSVHIESGYQ